MSHTIVETLNAVRILLRDDGKYGIEDMLSGDISFRNRTLDGARRTAAEMSAVNDRIDAYEKSKS